MIKYRHVAGSYKHAHINLLLENDVPLIIITNVAQIIWLGALI